MNEHVGKSAFAKDTPQSGALDARRDIAHRREKAYAQFKELLAFEKKIYSAFGIKSSADFEKDLKFSKPLCFVPKERRVVDYQSLGHDLETLLSEEKIDYGMYATLGATLKELRRREMWVAELLRDANPSGDKTDAEIAMRCYELVTGETNIQQPTPVILSLVITPITIHFLCGDSVTAERLYTLHERIDVSDDVRTVTPYDPDGDRIVHIPRGCALYQVARPGSHTVTFGVAEKRNIGTTGEMDMFRVFRHEFDHQAFIFWYSIQTEAIQKTITTLARRADSLFVRLMDGDVSDVLLEEFYETIGHLYYHSSFEKENSCLAVANEFVSQYLDQDAQYAHARVESDTYIENHGLDNLEESIPKYLDHILQLKNKKYDTQFQLPKSIKIARLAERVRSLRTKQIQNATWACNTMERYGFARQESMDMLRNVPFGSWASFVRVYGGRLRDERLRNYEQTLHRLIQDENAYTEMLQSKEDIGYSMRYWEKLLFAKNIKSSFLVYQIFNMYQGEQLSSEVRGAQEGEVQVYNDVLTYRAIRAFIQSNKGASVFGRMRRVQGEKNMQFAKKYGSGTFWKIQELVERVASESKDVLPQFMSVRRVERVQYVVAKALSNSIRGDDSALDDILLLLR